MQGVPDIEGMRNSEAPLDEIEAKTVIELFGIKVRTCPSHKSIFSGLAGNFLFTTFLSMHFRFVS
jgi:hypothetical protein